jgi:hypothetical protein
MRVCVGVWRDAHRLSRHTNFCFGQGLPLRYVRRTTGVQKAAALLQRPKSAALGHRTNPLAQERAVRGAEQVARAV